jgi:hypothetical protein
MIGCSCSDGAHPPYVDGHVDTWLVQPLGKTLTSQVEGGMSIVQSWQVVPN